MMDAEAPIGGIDLVTSRTNDPIHIAGYYRVESTITNIGGLYVVRGEPEDIKLPRHRRFNDSDVKVVAEGFAYIIDGVAYVTKADLVITIPISELTRRSK